MEDLSLRGGKLPKEQLQVTFSTPADEKPLNLSELPFKFVVQARRVRDLGDVSWNVTILSGSGSQKGVVNANGAGLAERSRASVKPITYGQVIQGSDVTERRVLSDQLPSEPLLDRTQVVGQQAARGLTVGSVVSARMVDAVPLQNMPGQLVTISLPGWIDPGQNGERGRWNPVLMDRRFEVRNETTHDVLEVVADRPSAGERWDPMSARQ